MSNAAATAAPAVKRGRNRRYRFEELNKAAKEAAREWFRKVYEWDSYDSDMLTEQFEQDLESQYGMSGMKVWWSLGSCQGDGVAFEGEPNIEEMAAACAEGRGWHAAACQQLQKLIDAAKVMAFLNNCHEPEWTVKIQYAGRSYGYGNMSINVYCENYWGERDLDQRILDSLASQAAEAVHDICSDACEVLETQGYPPNRPAQRPSRCLHRQHRAAMSLPDLAYTTHTICPRSECVPPTNP